MYQYVISPENFLFLLNIDKKIKIANVHIDSYKKVGCTYFTIPSSTISIFIGKFVSYPYASTLI